MSLPVEEVASRILVIRGEKVMIDADLVPGIHSLEFEPGHFDSLLLGVNATFG